VGLAVVRCAPSVGRGTIAESDEGCTRAKLVYAAFTSLDGYVADETGNFDWAELDDEVHAFINSRERQIGT
jgi:hypothetical protein